LNKHKKSKELWQKTFKTEDETLIKLNSGLINLNKYNADGKNKQEFYIKRNQNLFNRRKSLSSCPTGAFLKAQQGHSYLFSIDSARRRLLTQKHDMASNNKTNKNIKNSNTVNYFTNRNNNYDEREREKEKEIRYISRPKPISSKIGKDLYISKSNKDDGDFLQPDFVISSNKELHYINYKNDLSFSRILSNYDRISERSFSSINLRSFCSLEDFEESPYQFLPKKYSFDFDDSNIIINCENVITDKNNTTSYFMSGINYNLSSMSQNSCSHIDTINVKSKVLGDISVISEMENSQISQTNRDNTESNNSSKLKNEVSNNSVMNQDSIITVNSLEVDI